jgi:hypothetical protein
MADLMGLYILYESETNEYVARLLAASLLVSLVRKARQDVSFWTLKKNRPGEKTAGWREKRYS